MRERVAADVSELPSSGFGPKTLTWWGTLAFISLETSGFGLAVAAYLYLMVFAPKWPLNSPYPNMTAGTIVLVLFLLSEPLNVLLDRWARQQDLRKVQLGLVGMSVLGALPLIVRAFEFGSLNVRWDSDAYGSVQWFLLGLHTLHLLTDVGDTVVLTVLMFTRHAANEKRFSDVSDNAFYWHFVVAAWIPIYFLIYWVARL